MRPATAAAADMPVRSSQRTAFVICHVTPRSLDSAPRQFGLMSSSSTPDFLKAPPDCSYPNASGHPGARPGSWREPPRDYNYIMRADVPPLSTDFPRIAPRLSTVCGVYYVD